MVPRGRCRVTHGRVLLGLYLHDDVGQQVSHSLYPVFTRLFIMCIGLSAWAGSLRRKTGKIKFKTAAAPRPKLFIPVLLRSLGCHGQRSVTRRGRPTILTTPPRSRTGPCRRNAWHPLLLRRPLPTTTTTQRRRRPDVHHAALLGQ